MSDVLEIDIGVPEPATVATTPLAEAAPEKRPKRPRPPKGTPEWKLYNREATKKSREKKAVRSAKESRRYNAKTEITKKEARQILAEERGIRHPHVIDVLVDLAEVAARHHKLVYSAHLFTHGLRVTLAAQAQKTELPPPDIADEVVDGEILYSRDLRALWDFSMFRDDTSFDQWLSQRRICKSDAFLLGRDILGKDFHDSPHGVWRDFFPKFNPVGLQPEYSQEDLKAWLGVQDPVKTFNLVASRNAYKSSVAVVQMVSAVCCLPDITILICTETKPLARGFLRSLRGYFSRQSQPTRFHQLMPEMVIDPDDSSELVLQCPMAHLGLIESTAEATSMDSAAAGRRCMWLHADDVVSNLSGTANEEQRQSAAIKYGLLCKLVEPGGYATTCSTPWHVDDLTAELIKQAEEEPETRKYRIDPAFTVKPEAKHKKLEDLIEADVELLFPSRLSWSFLKREMKASRKDNYRTFRMQNLCEFLPEGEDEIKLHFDRDLLMACVVPQSAIPPGKTVLSLDLSFSLNAKSDLTSLCAGSVYEDSTNRRCLGILDIDAERMRGSEIALKIVTWSRKYSPSVVLIEAGPTSESLRLMVAQWAEKYGTPMPPLHFVQVSNQKDRKILAIQQIEGLISQNRIKFGSGLYLEPLFQELQRLDGAISLRSRRDDRADSIAQICSTFRLFSDINGNKPSEENSGEMERLQQKLKMKAMSERYFGQNFQTKPEKLPPPPEPDPRFANANRIFGSNGLAAYRRRGQ